MPLVYKYAYFSQLKSKLDPRLRETLNKTLSNIRMGVFNTPKKVAGGGQKLVKDTVNMAAKAVVWETRIDGHWRVFYFTNPGGNVSVMCIGHLDPNGRLMQP